MYNKPGSRLFLQKSISRRKKLYKWEYHDPPDRSPPVEFCLETSLHGLRYIGQKRRHTVERVFWLIAFIAAVVFAGMLIYTMWTNYESRPIVTVFTAKEMPLQDIPFPSVTICNANNMRKSQWNAFLKRAADMYEFEQANPAYPNKTGILEAYAGIFDLINICATSQTFSKRLVEETGNRFSKGLDEILKVIAPKRPEFEKYIRPTKTLLKGAQHCNDMILFCMWIDEIRDCSELFQEIETDYGYCCTFNTIPLTLLFRYFNDSRDSAETVKDWREANLSYDNLLFTEKTKERKYPFRQRYPGRSAGLTILLDPDLEEYSCSNTDSLGFVVGLNGPLDFPRMKDNGILVRTGSEIFMNVRPEITTSDDSIKKFDLEKRKCVFSNEKSLPHYSKYTASNCLNECIALKTKEKCNCVRYYMPRDDKDQVCKPEKYNCTDEIRRNIIKGELAGACDSCLPTCTEIDYHSDVTTLSIREVYMNKIFEAYPQHINKSANISILHIYVGVDSNYPRLRKEVYKVIDLISNTGALLGLCMGFSILSLLEIVYHCTLRLCFRYRRKRLEKAKLDNEEKNVGVDSGQPLDVRHNRLSKGLTRPPAHTYPTAEDNGTAVGNLADRNDRKYFNNFSPAMVPYYKVQSLLSNGFS